MMKKIKLSFREMAPLQIDSEVNFGEIEISADGKAHDIIPLVKNKDDTGIRDWMAERFFYCGLNDIKLKVGFKLARLPKLRAKPNYTLRENTGKTHKEVYNGHITHLDNALYGIIFANLTCQSESLDVISFPFIQDRTEREFDYFIDDSRLSRLDGFHNGFWQKLSLLGMLEAEDVKPYTSYFPLNHFVKISFAPTFSEDKKPYIHARMA